MNNFSASIRIDKLDGEAFDCDIRNFLLRGCTLRNIEYVQGIVVYIGKEAKIMLNAKKAPKKVSSMMKSTNIMLYSMFGF